MVPKFPKVGVNWGIVSLEDEKKVKDWLTACIADYGKSHNKAEIINLIYDNLVYLGYEEGSYRDDD